MKADGVLGGRTIRAGVAVGEMAYREIMHHIVYPVTGRRPAAMSSSGACHLTSPLRRPFQQPEEVLDAVGLQPGMIVLEIGPGPGFFTIPAAKRVGPAGRVVAVDVQQGMIDKLAEAVNRAGVSNVEMHIGDAAALPLPDASLDAAFMVAVLGEIPDQDKALAELRRVLKPSGILSICEVVLDPHRQSRSEVIPKCEQAGFEAVEGRGNWMWYVQSFQPSGLPVVPREPSLKGEAR